MEGKEKKGATKKLPKVDPPVYKAKSGAIIVSVWQKQSMTGYQYFDMSIERVYKRKTSDKWETSSNHFASNANDLIAAIQDASNWIREQEQLEDDGTAEASELPANAVAIGKITPVQVPASEAIIG